MTQISFILVRTSYPSNIGSCARAMHSMGFNDLRLVNPKADIHAERITKIATHGAHLLETMRIFDNLPSALADCDLVIGTSNKARKLSLPPISCRDLPQFLKERSIQYGHIGLVFGSESTGLKNEELAACHLLSMIPTNSVNHPLNLAQAVMVFAYELSSLFDLRLPKRARQQEKLTEAIPLQLLQQDVRVLLERLDFHEDQKTFQKTLARLALLYEQDFHLLRSFVSRLKDRL